MKWINHKVTTFSIVFLVTHDFVPSIIASMGSIIPDAIEGHSYDNKWRKRHRRISHWLFGYLVVAFLLWLFIKLETNKNVLSLSFGSFISSFSVFNSETLIFAALYICFYIFVGALLHVLEDSLSGTVPVLHPYKRVFTLGLMKTGSFMEYVLSFGIFLVSLLVR